MSAPLQVVYDEIQKTFDLFESQSKTVTPGLIIQAVEQGMKKITLNDVIRFFLED